MSDDARTDFTDTIHSHEGQPIHHLGADQETAEIVVILVHGHGIRAKEMLEFGLQIDRADVAYFAPQAGGGQWFPEPILAPIESNEPHLTGAFERITHIRRNVSEGGIDSKDTILLGYSQGGCIISEYVVRHPDRFGGIVSLSGALLGRTLEDRSFEGTIAETPVYVGCGNRDPHVPVERFEQTVEIFETLDGDVSAELYEGVGHTVLPTSLEFARHLVKTVAEQ